ncbi:MAG: SagB/ThcOx family dehydrogenase [Candidatus Abyssubacteria bacterium]
MEYEAVGDEYQRLTKYARGKLSGGGMWRTPRPSLRKVYERPLKVIRLPRPQFADGLSLWEALQRRRSMRSYKPTPLSLDELSHLVWATQGTTLEVGGHKLRTAPSAGALYPVETYLLVNRVEELAPGLYHYDALAAELQHIRAGNLGADATSAALGQSMVEEAAVVFMWTAIVERSKWKYAERAYRYIYMDAGHIGQNLYLAASALGLGCCTIGAFYDDEVDRLLGIDGVGETAIYMGCVGRL